MNYISLYRKYRPKTFKDVVGQEHIIQILKNSIKNDQVANAYVFAGTKGTGKTSIAKIFANAMNCLHNNDGDVCGECEICKDFKNNQVMDVIEQDAASNNGVEEIRKINDAVYALPAKLNKKVYIIDEAHMLTTSAWNALLKTVEEPPKHVVFIFATTEIHKIPTTILSRCQCLTFNKIMHSDIVKLLTKVCDAEGYKYQPEALKAIADIADGSARDSLSKLEQVATFGNNKVNIEDIYSVYGLLSPKDAVDFLNLLSENKNDKIFEQANKYFDSGVNFVDFSNLIVSVLTDKLIFLKTNNYKLLSKTNEVLINSLNINDINRLMELLDIWQETYFKVSVPTDVSVVIDHSILKSLALFDKKEETIKIKPVVSAPIKETMVEVVNDEPLFKVTQFKISIPSFESPRKETKPIEEPKVKSKPVEEKKDLELPSEKDILLSVASNKSNKELNEVNKIFEQIKNGDIHDSNLSCCSLAQRVLFASENGIVLLFEDDIDAKILNKNIYTEKFQLSCCKEFRNPKYIVGFTANQINSLKNEIKQAMHNKIEELNVELLRNILDKNNSIEQIAFNTIFKFLDEKDKK